MTMKPPFKVKHLLRCGLIGLISFNLMIPNAFAQSVPRIELVVVEGEGAINNIRQRVARDPIVRVEDENHRPVVGAIVVFTLPISGTTGEFSNGSKTLTVTTDQDGLAAAHGLKTNQVEGKLQIHVTASYRGLQARTLINQSTAAGPGAATHAGSSSKVWIILAVVAAAAAGGAVAATHKGSSTAPSAGPGPAAAAPIGITPGTGTIGPPR